VIGQGGYAVASSPRWGEVGLPREAQPSGLADRVRGREAGPLIASRSLSSGLPKARPEGSALLPEGEKTLPWPALVTGSAT